MSTVWFFSKMGPHPTTTGTDAVPQWNLSTITDWTWWTDSMIIKVSGSDSNWLLCFWSIAKVYELSMPQNLQEPQDRMHCFGGSQHFKQSVATSRISLGCVSHYWEKPYWTTINNQKNFKLLLTVMKQTTSYYYFSFITINFCTLIWSNVQIIKEIYLYVIFRGWGLQLLGKLHSSKQNIENVFIILWF
jgi:hypothetical protein